MQDFARRALVTGGASGIGLATRRLLADRGWSVIGLDRSSRLGDDDLVIADVSDPEAVEWAVAEAIGRLGGLDSLICVAGISEHGSVEETEPEDWDRIMGVNAKGPYLCVRAAIDHLRQGQEATIVTVSSQFGLMAAAGYVGYCASKAALVNLTRAMAVDYGPEGIRVNGVCPGPVDTPMAERHIAATADPEQAREDFTARTVSGRYAQPEELAAVIAFLAGGESSALFGSIVIADGGFSIH
jgi:2-keto-3-deoxy-L-fuconate dehydrogenase